MTAKYHQFEIILITRVGLGLAARAWPVVDRVGGSWCAIEDRLPTWTGATHGGRCRVVAFRHADRR
jgi:hypothetical protein